MAEHYLQRIEGKNFEKIRTKNELEWYGISKVYAVFIANGISNMETKKRKKNMPNKKG